jgi:hypothetical protein
MLNEGKEALWPRRVAINDEPLLRLRSNVSAQGVVRSRTENHADPKGQSFFDGFAGEDDSNAPERLFDCD